MKLLITRSAPNEAHFWEVDQNKSVTKLEFPHFFDHEICCSKMQYKMNLPWELTLMILGRLFKIYLKTYNFDLASDLLLIRKEFINKIYKEFYLEAKVDVAEKYRRLSNTLWIYQELHDNYLSVICQRSFSIFKLVRVGPPHDDTCNNPWDYCFDFFIEPLHGPVIETKTPSVYARGSTYGDQVWAEGRWKNGYFECSLLQTPIINLKFVDIFDTLQLTPIRIKQNPCFERFFSILRHLYGRFAAVNVMVQDEHEEDWNPFISSSTTFIRF